MHKKYLHKIICTEKYSFKKVNIIHILKRLKMPQKYLNITYTEKYRLKSLMLHISQNI